MKKWIILAVVLLFVTGQNAIVKADEMSDLKQQLAEQHRMLQQMQEKLAKLETQQTQQEEKVEKQITRAIEDKKIGALPDSMKWVENIKWGGDFRYRHEQYDDTDAGTEKRRRNRIRARLKMQAKVNDDWDAIFQLASGSSDSPTSTNQTLGDSGSNTFSSKEIWIDQAYANWHPASKPGFNMFFGKMKNPFYKVGGNQLIWDGDVTPEGIAASYTHKLNDNDTATFTAGGFWLAERNNNADSGYFGLQGMLNHDFTNGSHLLAGASVYDIGNLNPAPNGTSPSLGNTLVGSAYKYDYKMLEGFAEYDFKINEMPVAVYGNYIKNTGAVSGKDTAYMLGFNLNKAKKPGSWQFGYNYRDVQSDAVFAGLCDSDFMLGGTNGKGHSFGAKYQIDKNLQAAFTYLVADRYRNSSTNGTQSVNVLQADLIWKF